ncbi:T9SS sorting signal type C domain-containing protein [Flavobacterium nackdongense]|uniref:T9SS sorting signal type C domain-containing protein n=1 Tax=Flavobacterium nackdongense TaxID=2547394 RepID=A0A4P6YAT8_9FLAO|nr:T9SS sorting signal type C domain-containing protein [Flavobacterium nackdongense]QBN17874.1 T9SS sorting signal type C domain-containing protein [Flavobacterium nackdongense]
MKRITLKKGITMAILLLAGSIYSQTPVNNLIRLTSLNPASGGTTSSPSIISQDDSSITIDAAGAVTIASDYTPIAAAGNTTGTILIGGARNKTISVQLNAGSVVDQTVGATLGAITTTAGIQRASDGGIGVTTVAGASSGIDNGEGITFGLDLSSLPSTVAVQISRVYFSTFGTAESCTVVNRQDTSQNTTVVGFSGNAGNRDISTLGISIPGGTIDLDAVSFFNSSATAQNFRITGIEIRIVALSTVWNGTSWSNAAPGPAVDAFIEGNYSASATGGFSANNLTINSGSLTIEATKNLKIERSVVNNAGPNGIIVEEGGTLQQVLSTGLNSGAITVKKNSNLLFRNDYTMWSSPVAGSTTLEQFSPLTAQTPNNRFYVYNPTSNLYENVAPSSSFNIAKGYLIRMPNENPADLGTSSAYYTGASAINFSGTVVGVPNNGTLTLTGLATDSFHATGNPYPSNLDADLFLGGNTTGGTLYFWRKTNGAVGTAYATYTLAGGVANGGFPAPTKIIAPCQGFIVKTGVGISSLTFTNAMRPNNAVAGQFLKTKQTGTKDRVWLKLSNASGTFNQALIAYMDGATTGVDNGIDGEYINDSKVALTSRINASEYVIQGRPAFDATDVVALNFKTDVAGDFSISLDQFDGVFATGQAVYLVDSTTGTETDLKSGAYNFNAAAGVDNSRFTLKYQKTLKVINAEFNDNSITVYGQNGTLLVKSGAKLIHTVKVFDIQGRLLAEQKNVKSTAATISNLKTNQALIVQVSSEDNQVVIKKVLN